MDEPVKTIDVTCTWTSQHRLTIPAGRDTSDLSLALLPLGALAEVTSTQDRKIIAIEETPRG